jgi:transcriptional regulator with XRE-family HTH domain
MNRPKETISEDVIEQHVARRIRQVRAARGMTLQQVSDRTGLSKGLLSKIENCIVLPSLGTLAKLASALETPIGEFFEMQDLEPGSVFFPQSRRKRVQGRRSELNYEYELLVSGRKRRDMQPLMISINGESCKFALREHPGEQFIFMLEGLMDYVVGEKTYRVEPGDCLYFDARVPHGPKVHKNQKARYLVVFTGC